MMSRMRLIDGVTRVALNASEKNDTASGGGADCRGSSTKFPQFSIVVYFAERTSAPAAQSSPTTTPVSQKGSK
jgi:hypothetical protein